MLSAHERRQLRNIEQRLEADDPDFARTLTGPPATTNHGRQTAASLLATLALVLIVLGTMAAAFPLLFFGAVTAMIAACLHCTKHKPQ